MENKLINQIDLNLTKAEIESLMTDVSISLAFVTDVNHDGNGLDDLNPGQVRAKSLDMAGSSELSDSVYTPVNKNITNYPLAGEFIVALSTSLGNFYLTSVNLFSSETTNIDTKNILGYVNYTDDENIVDKEIKGDKKSRKSVLENNQPPFDNLDFVNRISYTNNFGDIGVHGRYGNRISFTKSKKNNPVTLIQNDISTIEMTTDDFVYSQKSSQVYPPSNVSTEISSEYTGQQIFLNSDRLFTSIGNKGIFQETSGMMALLSNDNMTLYSSNDIEMDGNKINIGSGAYSKVIHGDPFLMDFKELMDSMVRFAETLSRQDRILTLSNAANNFLTDLNRLGWSNFNEHAYLSNKVYVE